MKNIDWKILNSALLIEMVLSYLLPFQITSDLQYRVGFPMPFISVWDREFGVNPFASMFFNPLGLFFDVCTIYLVVLACVKAYRKLKQKK